MGRSQDGAANLSFSAIENDSGSKSFRRGRHMGLNSLVQSIYSINLEERPFGRGRMCGLSLNGTFKDSLYRILTSRVSQKRIEAIKLRSGATVSNQKLSSVFGSC